MAFPETSTRSASVAVSREAASRDTAGHGIDGEAQWRSLFEHAADGMLLTVPDGRILAANAAACALLGHTEREICELGRGGLVVLDDAAARFLAERQRTGLARGKLTMHRKGGTTFLADVASTVFTTSSGETRTSMTLRDVTEAERAHHGLEILADAGRVLGSSLDENTTLANLTSLVVPKLADVCTIDLLTPEGVARVAVAHRDPSRLPEFRLIRRRAIRPDAPSGADYVLRTGEPSVVLELTDEWLRGATLDPAHFEAARKLGIRSFVAVPLIAEGRTLGALTVMSDGGVPTFSEADVSLVRAIGERAAAAIGNARKHAEVLEARRLRDEVLGVVAHDLRTPLNAIHLAATLLARRAPSAETETIKRAVNRANVLIHDLLLAAKADTGSLPLVRRRVHLDDVLGEVAELHRSLAEAKSLDLVVSVHGEAPHVEVDAHRIVQMLSNLVANAIKFTPAGGRVELRAQAECQRTVLVVSDTGPGIAPDELPHIFDRFWQGAHSQDAGAGLGLSISRAIAKTHGGDISVETAPERGTTFTIVLPTSPA